MYEKLKTTIETLLGKAATSVSAADAVNFSAAAANAAKALRELAEADHIASS